MAIEDDIEGMIKENTPQAKAVETLTTVKPHKPGEHSDVELKTDLTDVDVCLHSSVEVINAFCRMTPVDFEKTSVVDFLIQKKERKLLSLNRKSRIEIVDVARNPDVAVHDSQIKEGFVKRLFTPRGGNRQKT